jgi:hypothetical protein
MSNPARAGDPISLSNYLPTVPEFPRSDMILIAKDGVPTWMPAHFCDDWTVKACAKEDCDRPQCIVERVMES